MKEKFLQMKNNAVLKFDKGDAKILGFGTAVAIPALAFADTPLISTTGVDFMAVLNEMVALVPTVLPVIVGCLAFRKGFQFLKSAIKGA